MGKQDIYVVHHSKGWTYVEREGYTPYVAWTHIKSWSGAQQGTLVGTFIRALRNCSRQPMLAGVLVGAMMGVAVEAVILGGYSKRAVLQCLRYLMGRQSGDDARMWRCVALFLTWCTEWVHVKVWWEMVVVCEYDVELAVC